jgi:hypothetical protein
MAVFDGSDDRPGREQRIETAVQRELAQRRRLMSLYLLLLLIPLGVGGWFLYTGISAPPPPPRISTGLPPETQRQIEEQKVQIAAQKKQVEELTRTQKDLQVQVKKVGSGLEGLEPRIMANVPPNSGRVEIAAVHSNIDARLDNLAKRISQIEETQAGLLEQQKKILAELEEIRRGQPQ